MEPNVCLINLGLSVVNYLNVGLAKGTTTVPSIPCVWFICSLPLCCWKPAISWMLLLLFILSVHSCMTAERDFAFIWLHRNNTGQRLHTVQPGIPLSRLSLRLLSRTFVPYPQVWGWQRKKEGRLGCGVESHHLYSIWSLFIKVVLFWRKNCSLHRPRHCKSYLGSYTKFILHYCLLHSFYNLFSAIYANILNLPLQFTWKQWDIVLCYLFNCVLCICWQTEEFIRFFKSFLQKCIVELCASLKDNSG